MKNCSHFARVYMFNSLSPGRSECDSKNVIFNLVLLIGIFRSSRDNALRWMPQDLTDDKSTLVQVMAWCRQTTSHYLSQCWLSSLSPYGVARPQLEQLERLRSEDTPRRPVITLTIDQFILNPKSILLISSYPISSQKKVKAEKIRKICEKI